MSEDLQEAFKPKTDLNDRSRKTILVLVDWFYPGYKAGGPIQSCRNFAEYMKDDYKVFVLTSDRDLGDKEAYAGIRVNTWNQYNSNVSVYYASSLGSKELVKIVCEVEPDFVYLNSMFSGRFAILPMILKRLGRIQTQIILSPRGMLRQSALGFKSTKKKIFLQLFRTLGLPQLIRFHATDETERKDILSRFPKTKSVSLIPNFPGAQRDLVLPIGKTGGKLRLIFVGRIHPIKNLDIVLNALCGVSQQVRFTIVAAIEDEAYWKKCEALIAALPMNISVEVKANVQHDKMKNLLEMHDLFVLPTKGENFGHAIFEALSAGRPVLISDQTPWRGLAASGAGWDISLQNPAVFSEIIERVALMEASEHTELCRSTWAFCHRYITSSGIKEQYQKLFN